MDLMYDMENSLAVRYGTSAWTNGQLSYNDEGKVVFNVPAMPENKGSSAIADEDRPIHDFVWYIQQETQQTADKYYDLDSNMYTSLYASWVGVAQELASVGMGIGTELIEPEQISKGYADYLLGNTNTRPAQIP